MKMINAHSLLRTVSALAFSAMRTSHSLATPSAESRRFFDIEKGRSVFNPDYR